MKPLEAKSLLSLVDDTNRVIESIIANDGSLTEEQNALLEIGSDQIAKKVDNYAYVIDRLEHEAGFWKAKAEFYSTASRTMTNTAAAMKERLKMAMMTLGHDELAGEDIKYKLCKAAPRLLVDQLRLTAEYIVRTVVESPDKDKIKAALMLGLPVVGASFEPNWSLRSYPSTSKSKKEISK